MGQKQNQFNLKVSKQLLNNEVVRVISGVYNLTDRESEILAEFIGYKGNTVNLLTNSIRKSIVADIGIHDTYYSTLVESLKSKGVLVNVNNGWQVLPELLPNIIDNKVEVTFVITIE